MPRLQSEILERTKRFAHRVVDVAEALARGPQSQRVRGRVIDQLVGCGTSVGANTREASEAMSRADFCKCVATVMKELAECEFWLEFVSERGWISASRLSPLLAELDELTKIFNTILARSRRAGQSTAKKNDTKQ